MGSETIPPCKENVIHITLDKPLELPNCQFKLLRESSLVKSRMKEIHSRLEMPINDRNIYKFDAKNISHLPSVEGLIPLSYLKYLISKGYKFKLRKDKIKGKDKKKKKIQFKKIYDKARKPKDGKFGPGFRKGRVIENAKDSCYVNID